MTIDFTQPILFDAANNGYMVTVSDLRPATDGGPNYEICEADLWCPLELKTQLKAWLAAGNKAQPYVPPAPVPPTIQQQLAALDAIISRDVEDWYAESGKTPAYGPRAEAIKQKQALRAQLKGTQS